MTTVTKLEFDPRFVEFKTVPCDELGTVGAGWVVLGTFAAPHRRWVPSHCRAESDPEYETAVMPFFVIGRTEAAAIVDAEKRVDAAQRQYLDATSKRHAAEQEREKLRKDLEAATARADEATSLREQVRKLEAVLGPARRALGERAWKEIEAGATEPT